PAPDSETQSLCHSALYILMRQHTATHKVSRWRLSSIAQGYSWPRSASPLVRMLERARPTSRVFPPQTPNSWIIRLRGEKLRSLPHASASVHRLTPGSSKYQRSSDPS